jgi:hypothetical protein
VDGVLPLAQKPFGFDAFTVGATDASAGTVGGVVVVIVWPPVIWPTCGRSVRGAAAWTVVVVRPSETSAAIPAAAAQRRARRRNDLECIASPPSET